jgi:hypothetical protein
VLKISNTKQVYNDCCYTLAPPSLSPIDYTTDGSVLTVQVPDFSLSNEVCSDTTSAYFTYSANQVAPFITFDPATTSFQVSSKSLKNEGVYHITVVGTFATG